MLLHIFVLAVISGPSKPIIKLMLLLATRSGLPITLSSEVDGDPNHYWVGWFYKTSTIQSTGDALFLCLQASGHHTPSHCPLGETRW